MIFHENRLPADNSHEISCFFVILEKGKHLKVSSAANYMWRFMGKQLPGLVPAMLGDP